MLFETTRLMVRRLGPDDEDALLAVYGDGDAMRFVGDGQPLDRAVCRRWIEVTQRNYATRGYGMNAVVLRASGRVAGFAGLVHPGQQVLPEVKYAFLREHWGQGLATELVPALLAFGRANWGLDEIIATVAPEHLASQRVLAKAGMQVLPARQNDDGSTSFVFSTHPPRASPSAPPMP
jgi:[ribosomal protein S5]-alanine N-acetyltransferase